MEDMANCVRFESCLVETAEHAKFILDYDSVLKTIRVFSLQLFYFTVTFSLN